MCTPGRCRALQAAGTDSLSLRESHYSTRKRRGCVVIRGTPSSFVSVCHRFSLVSRYIHKRLINAPLLLLQADNLAGKLSVERNLYTLLHEELAGKGMSLPMVGPAIATDFGKLIRRIRVKACKMEARTELVDIMLRHAPTSASVVYAPM